VKHPRKKRRREKEGRGGGKASGTHIQGLKNRPTSSSNHLLDAPPPPPSPSQAWSGG